MCLAHLFFVETTRGPVLVDQSFGVSEPDALPAFFERSILFLKEREAQQVCDAYSGFSSTHDQDAVFLDHCVRHLQCTLEAGQTHARSSLDIVIKRTLVVSILFQESECIFVAKVFELHQAVFPVFSFACHE